MNIPALPFLPFPESFSDHASVYRQLGLPETHLPALPFCHFTIFGQFKHLQVYTAN